MNVTFNSLSANPTKWSNTLKQFAGNLPTNCLSVFDLFLKLALKGLRKAVPPLTLAVTYLTGIFNGFWLNGTTFSAHLSVNVFVSIYNISIKQSFLSTFVYQSLFWREDYRLYTYTISLQNISYKQSKISPCKTIDLPPNFRQNFLSPQLRKCSEGQDMFNPLMTGSNRKVTHT